MHQPKPKGRVMITTPTKPKTAANLLADKMDELIDKAAETMTDKQFKEAEKRDAEASARVRARASRRDTT